MKFLKQFICTLLIVHLLVLPILVSAETNNGTEQDVTAETLTPVAGSGGKIGQATETSTINGETETEQNTDQAPEAVMPPDEPVTETPVQPEVPEAPATPAEEAAPEEKTVTAADDSSEPVTGYFTINVAKANIYMMVNGAMKAMGELYKGEEFYHFGSDDQYFITELGGKQAFVKKEHAISSDGSNLQNPTSNKTNAATVKLGNKAVPVYENSISSTVVGTLYAGREVTAFMDIGKGYFINIGNHSGFIFKTDIARDFRSTDKYFTTVEQTPVYIRTTGSNVVQQGYIPAGVELERVSYSDKYHHIRYGNKKAHILIEGTIPSDGSNITVYNEKHSNVFLNTKTTWVYSSASTGSKRIGYINAGQKLPIIKKEGTWFVIQYGGHKGYIHPTRAVPVYQSLVTSNVTYTYDQMGVDIKELEVMYDGLVSSEIIGKSVDGRNLYAVKLGTGKKEIFFNGSHHAREHMTTNLLMEMIDTYAYSYMKGTKIKNYNTKSILNQVSIWFVPMVNPDGVTLVQKGHTSAKNPAAVLKLNGGSTNFKAWKANIRGVDLNRQYTPNWSKITATKPGPKNYKGTKAFSEPEVVSLVRFVRKHNFKSATAYHSSGSILYWHYHQKGAAYTRDKQIARQYSNLTGYSLVADTKPGQGGGGFKDWFISETKMTGFTPEIAPYVGERPVPNSYWPSVWQKNHAAGLMLANDAIKR